MTIAKSSPCARYSPQNALWFSSAGILLVIFGDIADDIWRHDPFSWDISAMQFVHAYSRPWLNVVMLAITQTGGVLTALVFIALLYWLYWLGEFRWMWAAAVSFLGTISVNALLKLWFARPRPDVFTPLMAVHTFSFPSGHTAAAVSLYGFLAFVLWRADKKPLAVLAVLWVFLVALSRVYLGVHYPSDVLGALTFGGAWLLGVMGWFFMRGS